MGHKQDFWERIRRMFARPIGALVTGVRCSKESPARFVGYVKMDEEEFEKELHEMGFHRNPLAYWKKTLKILGHEEGSWRMVDGKWQLHVVLYTMEEHPDRTYVYAHWEHRWDRDPFAHLRADDFNISKGVNEMRRQLNLASIPFYNDPEIQ